jgi:hypothetical protein
LAEGGLAALRNRNAKADIRDCMVSRQVSIAVIAGECKVVEEWIAYHFFPLRLNAISLLSETPSFPET